MQRRVSDEGGGEQNNQVGGILRYGVEIPLGFYLVG